MTIYIALLRGINVGGKNKIKMADLREALGSLELTRVQTYIQSGNILFESDQDEARLREQIEQQITQTFGLSIIPVLRTAEQLQAIAEGCPFSAEQIAAAEAGTEHECLYVSMLLDKPHAERVEKLKAFDARGDQYVIAGRDVFLLFRQSVRDSKLAPQIEKLGVPVTTRNWKTIGKLVALAADMANSRTE